MFICLSYGCTLTPDDSFQLCVKKKVWLEELLDEKVKELYIKVAFINIVYVTWNNYRLKSEEKKRFMALIL